MIKPPVNITFSGSSKNMIFVPFRYVQQKLKIQLNRQALTAAHNRLVKYLSDYQYIFRNKTKTFFDKAQFYTQGILRRNIEKITDNLLDPNYFQIQHFITDSNWSYRKVIDAAAIQTSNSLFKVKLSGFFVDETGVEN